MSGYPSVIAAVINNNGKRWLDKCLSSLTATAYPNFTIIVLDDASRDGSVPFIKDNFSTVEVVRNERNIGFARTVNRGISIALERGVEYIAILNPDIKVNPVWMSELIKIAEKDKEIGILMPLHHDYSGDKLDPNLAKLLAGNPQYLKDRDAGNLGERYEVDTAIGGCMILRISMIQKIGYIEPIYFLYGEDSDLARRALFHGYKIVVATRSKVMHWHRILHKDKIDRRIGFHMFRSQFIYLLKDPDRPFLRNLRQYYFNKEEGAWKIIKHWAPLSNLKYLAMAIYVQFWIFIHLPIIFIRHSQDRKTV